MATLNEAQAIIAGKLHLWFAKMNNGITLIITSVRRDPANAARRASRVMRANKEYAGLAIGSIEYQGTIDA